MCEHHDAIRRKRLQGVLDRLDRIADLTYRPGTSEQELAAMVERIITSERFTLLERLATRIADVALADERVDSVTVSVRKLEPPVPQQLTTSGVRITRTR